MTLTPAGRLYGLGAILLAALTSCTSKFSSIGEPSFIIPLGVAGLAYLLAIRELFATPQFPRRVIVIGLVLAALWRIPFLLSPPGPDDDIHRYLWDGRVQRLGYNPYLVVPSDPVFRALHTPETRTLNNPDLTSPYPPGAQVFFRVVIAIHESLFSLKIAFVICDLAIVCLLLEILRRSGQGAHWVLAYAWHPLLATDVAGSGHIDIVGVLLLLMSAAALGRGWRAVAALAFGLAVAVKFLPIVLLPLYWKRIRIRDSVSAAAVVGLLYLPFLNHGRIPIGSLGTYVRSFRFNDPVFATIERVAAPNLQWGWQCSSAFLLQSGKEESRWHGLRTNLLGPWQHRLHVRQSYIRGICYGCCRSCGQPRPCRSSSGQLASFQLTTFGICVRLVVLGWSPDGLWFLSMDLWRWLPRL